MKTRNQIDEKYKWNFDGYDLEKSFLICKEKIENLINKLPEFDGKLNTADNIYKFFILLYTEQKEIYKFSHYLHNFYNVDNSNLQAITLTNQFDNVCKKLDEASSFVNPQLLKLPEKFLLSLLQDKRFKDYDNEILEIIKNKPHRIDENTSKILSKISPVLGKSEDVFDIITNSELTFEQATDSKGKKYTVDNASFNNLISSKDKVLRASSYNSLMNCFGKFNKTFTSLYLNDIETDKISCNFHKYKSILEMTLDEEDIPKTVYEKVIENTNKNIPLLQKFVKAFKKRHNISNMEYFDLFMDEKFDGKFSIEDAQNLIINALSPLGNDYINLVKKKFNDHSIDYLPNKNKYSGAYCSNCYDTKTLILMNFTNNYDSVSALIHEMGHCINAELFNANQPYTKADITIFLAEIASTVNEILLNLYMQKNSKNKAYYLERLLDIVRGTIFTQIIYSEFESFAHNAVEQEQSITYQDLNNCYYNLHKKYYGTSCKLPKSLQYGWSRIPHFYTPFYVYKYATGIITAINIVNNITTKKDYYKKYIQFLKNGTNKKPIDILKEIDIDLTTDEPYNLAFNFINAQIKDYINA